MKKQQKNTVTTWVENEQSTIMSALIYLTRSTESMDRTNGCHIGFQ